MHLLSSFWRYNNLKGRKLWQHPYFPACLLLTLIFFIMVSSSGVSSSLVWDVSSFPNLDAWIIFPFSNCSWLTFTWKIHNDYKSSDYLLCPKIGFIYHSHNYMKNVTKIVPFTFIFKDNYIVYYIVGYVLFNKRLFSSVCLFFTYILRILVTFFFNKYSIHYLSPKFYFKMHYILRKYKFEVFGSCQYIHDCIYHFRCPFLIWLSN